MCRFHLCLSLWLGWCVCLLVGTSRASELAGVVVRFEKYEGPATIGVESLGQFKFKMTVDPKTEREPLAIRVELPTTGREAWPVVDVEVRDSRGQAIAVQRGGTEWHRLLIPVPATTARYLVQVVDPQEGQQQKLPAEKEPQLTDQKSGLNVSIARWYDGRQAVLSLRFDDSHPTHLSKAIPILREYGFRGTFMINPGQREPNCRRRSSFEDHQAEWEAVARRGDHEFANHSAHHRGAIGDEDMEAEIGQAAQAIWKLSPDKSKLTALNLGGGTLWETTRTLRYYLENYHQFDALGNSTGMDDTYGNRVETFGRMLAQHLERGLWFRVHYHYIGDGLSSSEANFRAVLEIAKEHQADLWIAGMADIHKYQTERNGAALSLVNSSPQQLSFNLSCLTDVELYDQPLTIEVTPPKSWPLARIVVTDKQGQAIAVRTVHAAGQMLFRFELTPRTADYTITWSP